jgi:hypothetical protein
MAARMLVASKSHHPQESAHQATASRPFNQMDLGLLSGSTAGTARRCSPRSLAEGSNRSLPAVP